MKTSLFSCFRTMPGLAILFLTTTAFSQNWNAFNDFWYTKGLDWSGSTTPNAWGYFAGTVAGGASASQIGAFIIPDNLYSLSSGGSAGTGNGTGDGNVVLYTDYDSQGVTSLGRYSTGTVYTTGARAAGAGMTVVNTLATNGYVGGAASFNGVNSYIAVGTSASVNPSALTYSAWINASSLSDAYASVISKAENNGDVGTLLLKSNGKLACYVGASVGVVDYDGTGISTLNTDQWYYVTLTYDSVNGLNGYVNGVLDGSAPANGPINTGPDEIWIGAHPTAPGRVFNGVIDEARISTVARDANWVWAEWMNMANNSTFNNYGAATANTSGYFTSWSHSCRIAFSGYTNSETLTDFPVLVNIGTNLSGFAWSQFSNTNGYELRFADANGNELAYERDNAPGTNSAWINSAGVGQVWVQVPQLSSSTVITAYWGNSAATASISSYCTNGAVWSNQFGGVWHLPNGQLLSAEDSTSNQNDGAISVTSYPSTPGLIDGAATFNGETAYINVGSTPTVNPSALTYSAWINASSLSVAYASIISKAENGNVGTLLLKSNGKLACYVGASGGVVDYDGTGVATVNTDQWYYVTLAYDSVNGLNGYVNGVLDGSAPANGPINTGPDEIWIGSHPSIEGRNFSGVIDEARISTVARDASWVWAEWMNMANNSTFNNYGAATANTSGYFTSWSHSCQIAFSGYTNSETLTDFPVLVNIGTNLSGFAWSQFANTNGYELRFADANGNELAYERDNAPGTNSAWINSAGVGQVWVQVPQLSSSTVITAYWGNPAAAASLSSYCTNGAVWSNQFGGVWHLSTYNEILNVDDSTANKNNGQSAATPGGIGYQNTQYLWAQAANFELAGGVAPPSADEGFASVLTWTAPSAGIYGFSGSFLPGASGEPDQTNVDVAIVDSLGGTDLVRTVLPQGGEAFPYNFNLKMNAGDSVQFQVGDDFEFGAPVGIAANVTELPSPAEVISASRPETNASEILLTFAAPLYGPSVTNVANYLINGVTVTSAQLTGSESNEVVLTISPGLNYPTTITVNGVANANGQLPATNSMATVGVSIYVPDDIGSATNAAQDTFSGNNLNPNWQSGLANFDSGNANYYNSLFVQSNGVLHCSCDTNWDLNYLVYVDPSYQGQVQEALMHFTITAANFDAYAVAGVGVGVQPNPWGPPLEGGDCLRTVNSGYADDGVDYPFFLACSDDVTDNLGHGDSYNLQWNVGGSYWLRIRQDIDTNPATDGTPGGIISTKAWAGDGSEPEPTNWQSVWKDPNGGVTRSGYAAIRAGYGVGAIMNFNVDYFLVKAAGLPTIKPTLPSSLVPVIDLGVAVNGNEAILSWPAAVGEAFQLQSAASLTSGWSNVTTPVVVSGVQNTVTVPLNGRQNFFRLIQQ